MEISQAQRDVRTTFLGGFAGQLVSSLLWFASSAAATWRSPKAGILVLVIGGFFIFPLTQLVLRMMGHRASLPKGHPMNALATQIAFIVPLCLPVIAGATFNHRAWFYPAFMIVVGAHYLPFMFLYGMKQFGLLAALMIAAGVVIGMYLPTAPFSTGGWITAVLLLIFAIVGRSVALAGASSPANSA